VEKINQDAFKKIRFARGWLVHNHTFFAAIAMRWRLVEDAKIARGTAATDGIHLFYCPDFIMKQSKEKLRGLLIHEAMHVALLHMLRRGSRHHMGWNWACDAAINPLVVKIGSGVELPDDGIQAPEYENMTAEEIYSKMPKVNIQFSAAGGVMDPRHGDGTPLSEDEKQELEVELRDVVIQAASMAQKAGQLPEFMKRLIDDTHRGIADWRELFRDWIAKNIPIGLTWERCNRRMLGMGTAWPSTLQDGTSEIVLLMDTSGSIGDEILSAFQGEIDRLVGDVEPDKVHVVWFSDRLHHVDVFGKGDRVALVSKWSGGTDYEPAFRYVDDLDVIPTAVVMFTDLEPCGWPPDRTSKYPVLFANYNTYARDRTAPWGQTVQITP